MNKRALRYRDQNQESILSGALKVFWNLRRATSWLLCASVAGAKRSGYCSNVISIGFIEHY